MFAASGSCHYEGLSLRVPLHLQETIQGGTGNAEEFCRVYFIAGSLGECALDLRSLEFPLAASFFWGNLGSSPGDNS